MGRRAKCLNLLRLYPPPVLAVAQRAVAIARALQATDGELRTAGYLLNRGLDVCRRTTEGPARQGRIAEASRLLQYRERGKVAEAVVLIFHDARAALGATRRDGTDDERAVGEAPEFAVHADARARDFPEASAVCGGEIGQS